MYWNSKVTVSTACKSPINRNMRCIEITAEKQRWNRQIQINRNMRCIEIRFTTTYTEDGRGLIETWDVLKSGKKTKNLLSGLRLMETWDVLKSDFLPQCFQVLRRLIETWDVLKYLAFKCCITLFCWLIETWDVLKYPDLAVHNAVFLD